eukprot:TRINITY_DN9197_c1_g1_i2.p1 TRINITY_DN9197_c1_g1~~TRINITY_DN9197_c1_g1_i2.p1  ORF type:complete len:174 (+),score=0.95 TRINITY_DN9197_c1_g1_i2:633-1154(+)
MFLERKKFSKEKFPYFLQYLLKTCVWSLMEGSHNLDPNLQFITKLEIFVQGENLADVFFLLQNFQRTVFLQQNYRLLFFCQLGLRLQQWWFGFICGSIKLQQFSSANLNHPEKLHTVSKIISEKVSWQKIYSYLQKFQQIFILTLMIFCTDIEKDCSSQVNIFGKENIFLVNL